MRRALVILGALTLSMGVALAQQEGLEALRQKGYVRVCADPSNLPFTSTEAATPGFEIELARLIARELGIEARMEWTPTFVRALQPLRAGRCDLFLGLPADERFTESNPWIRVSRPYYVMGHAIVAPAEAGIAAPDDLRGKRVAIDAASMADFYLFDQGLERGIYRGQAAAFRAVVTGEAAAALLWLPVASWLARGDVVTVNSPRLSIVPWNGCRAAVRCKQCWRAMVPLPRCRLSLNPKQQCRDRHQHRARQDGHSSLRRVHAATGRRALEEGWGAPCLPFGITRAVRKNSCVSSRTARRGRPWEDSKAF
jgi:ABC-type amino acid transport substrate-binding protein